jgi:hypothetical protein
MTCCASRARSEEHATRRMRSECKRLPTYCYYHPCSQPAAPAPAATADNPSNSDYRGKVRTRGRMSLRVKRRPAQSMTPTKAMKSSATALKPVDNIIRPMEQSQPE